MVQLIVGAPGSGKTHEIRERIAGTAAEGRLRVILLVPEQYSFENERALYDRLGASGAVRAEVLSFTRLCELIFRACGGGGGGRLSETGRTLLISQALYELRDQLTLYRRQAGHPAFVTELAGTLAELQLGGVTPRDLAGLAIDEPVLAGKTAEIALLYEAYESCLARGWSDPHDDLVRAAEAAERSGFFSDTAVFVDGFKDFTGGERRLLEVILRQAAEVTLAFPWDGFDREMDGLFAIPRRTAMALLGDARRMGIPAAPFVRCEGSPRFHTPALRHLAAHYGRADAIPYVGRPEGIRLVRAGGHLDELRFVLCDILRRVREEGMRWRDFAVIGRGIDGDCRTLERMAEKLGIPLFCGRRQPIAATPLITVCRAAIDIVRRRFRSEDILRYLSTGLIESDVEAVAELDNYAAIWRLEGQDWLTDFTGHPRGFAGEMTEEDTLTLERLGILRRDVTGPLVRFYAAAKGDCRTIAAALYELLEETGVPARLEMQAEELEAAGRPALAARTRQLWQALCGLLDTLVQALGPEPMEIGRFGDLFSLAVSSIELGSLPESVDQVLVGEAGHVRTDGVKAVYLIGANEGIFPALPAERGLFSTVERTALREAGLEGLRDGGDGLLDERFLGYTALTCASDSLTLCHAACDLEGTALAPSELVTGLRALFPDLPLEDLRDEPDRWQLESPASVFDARTRRLGERNERTAAMEAALAEGAAGYAGRLRRVSGAAGWGHFAIEDPAVAMRLFGRSMRLSPSRIERYYRCPFAYFCDAGLRARPLRPAELSPIEAGSVIHAVLDGLLRTLSPDQLAALSDDALRARVQALVEGYVERQMGGLAGKAGRFRYLIGRLVTLSMQMVRHLADEFGHCDFLPADFELWIGEGGAVPPLELRRPDGCRVIIEGRVDRVDLLERDGARYVRVIDYKTGRKQFSLSDVYAGLNLQLLIYLFTLCQNGTGQYRDVLPAGALYLPAAPSMPILTRDASGEAVEAARRASYRMSGLVLNDRTAIEGMERELSGLYIPVKLDKNDNPAPAEALADLGQMGALAHHIGRLIAGMADGLYRGMIDPLPAVWQGGAACDWCDYRTVCLRREDDPARLRAEMKAADVFQAIEREEAAEEDRGREEI